MNFNLISSHSIISFYIRLGCSQRPPSQLNLPIILQSSSNGGITWDTIQEMTFDPQSNDPMYVALQLPAGSHSNATRIRWWQPSRDGAYIDEWAIDQVGQSLSCYLPLSLNFRIDILILSCYFQPLGSWFIFLENDLMSFWLPSYIVYSQTCL